MIPELGIGDWLAIGGALGNIILLRPKFASHIQMRRITGFWKTNKSGWALVKPVYQHESKSCTSPQMARIEDILAINAITRQFNVCDIPYIELSDNDPIPTSHNIILICGPYANAASRTFAERIKLPLEIHRNLESNLPYIHDYFSENDLYSPTDTKGQKVDLAIIARVTDLERGQRFVLCWGLHGVGTLGAAQILVNAAFVKHTLKRVGNKDFSAIIRVPFTSHTDIYPPALLTDIRSI